MEGLLLLRDWTVEIDRGTNESRATSGLFAVCTVSSCVNSWGRAFKTLGHLLWKVHEGRINGVGIQVAGVLFLCKHSSHLDSIWGTGETTS